MMLSHTGATPLVTVLMMGSKRCRSVSRYQLHTELVLNEAMLLRQYSTEA
jgi:hypothetical protein